MISLTIARQTTVAAAFTAVIGCAYAAALCPQKAPTTQSTVQANEHGGQCQISNIESAGDANK